MNELVQTNFISVTYRIGGLSGYKLTNIRVDEDTGSVVTPSVAAFLAGIANPDWGSSVNLTDFKGTQEWREP